MKSSHIIALLTASLATSTLALPSKLFSSTAMKRQAVNEDANNCNQADVSCLGVATAINSWTNDVNNVNTFLNNDAATTGAQLTTDTQNTLNFANDEPNELSILMATPGLSAAGQAAALTLMEVFGNVPEDLMMILAGTATAQNGINMINAVRCPEILPAITTLWTESAAAVGLPPPQPAGLPTACNEPNFGITK